MTCVCCMCLFCLRYSRPAVVFGTRTVKLIIMIETCTYVETPNYRWYDLIALHTRSDLVESCVALLNSEWSRSHAARLHSLTKSNDSLPASLALIEVDICTQSSHTVGHSRLAKVVNQPNSVLVESVVVQKYRRGEGLGKILMDLTETCCKKMGFTTVYLSTKDKQGFYSHIGYTLCSPVITSGAQMLSTCDIWTDCESSCQSSLTSSCSMGNNIEVEAAKEEVMSENMSSSTLPPPPPPPPPPNINHKGICQIWMKKDI